jgi:hypothetical protein
LQYKLFKIGNIELVVEKSVGVDDVSAVIVNTFSPAPFSKF